MASLLPELVDLIVQESIAEDLFRYRAVVQHPSRWQCNIGTMYPILLRLCRVDRSWAGVAQSHLMRRVAFSTSDSRPISSFVAYTMPRWASRVTALRLHFDRLKEKSAPTDRMLSTIVAGLPSLASLCLIQHADASAGFPSTWKALLELRTIRVLCLWNDASDVRFPQDLVHAYAPTLVGLQVEPQTDWDGRLESTDLASFGPSLQSLILVHTYPSSGSLQLSLAALIRNTAPTLEALCLGGDAVTSFDDDRLTPIRLPNLRSLGLRNYDGEVEKPLAYIMKHLHRLDTPRLAELDVAVKQSLCGTVVAQFCEKRQDQPLFPALQRLYVGMIAGEDEEDDNYHSLQEVLDGVIKRRGVQIVWKYRSW